MEKLFGNNLMRLVMVLLTIVSTNVWSENIDSELNSAADKGNFSLVKKILDSKTIERDALHTAFWIAVKKGNPAIIERFLQPCVE